ncbi:IS4 family transposase [Chondrinema litorale]|uniref:IS4 family transposase n=1 Tax=Chondrinema litorale TaxID=2994555 RepID=UPI0032B3D69C
MFFQDWNACLLHHYKRIYPRKTWAGFVVYGIDGTTINLPNTAKISKTFGNSSNQAASYPMARVLCAYDVSNGICEQSKIAPITSDELGMAIDFVDDLPPNSLSIYDRGFTSFVLLYLLKGKNYVMRSKITFNKSIKDFVKSKRNTAMVTLKATHSAIERLENPPYSIDKNASVTVRLVKVILDNGEVEVLMTSLLDTQQYPDAIFKDLYFLRWGVEVFFDYFKNILQVELFSGHLPEAIYQEFYTMVFLANLHSLLLKDCTQQLALDNKERKYEHKINNNVSVGNLKNNVIKIFIHEEPKVILEHLITLFLKSTEAIRPNIKGLNRKGVEENTGLLLITGGLSNSLL